MQDALSRLQLPEISTEAQEPIDEDVQMFEAMNVVKPFSSDSKIFVTTRRQKRKANTHITTERSREQESLTTHRPVNAPPEPSFEPSDAGSEAGEEPDLFKGSAWDDCDDAHPFDLSRARLEGDEKLMRTEPSDELPTPLTLEKLMMEQKSDFFFQIAL